MRGNKKTRLPWLQQIFIILFLPFLVISCNSGKTEDPEIISDQDIEKAEGLRETVYKVWEDANNGNISALKAAHLDSPKFSKFGPRIAERQNLESTNESEEEHFSTIKDVDLRIEDLKIDIFQNVGIATFYNIYSFTKNQTTTKGKGRVTLVFVQTEEGWKIAHEHSSAFNASAAEPSAETPGSFSN